MAAASRPTRRRAGASPAGEARRGYVGHRESTTRAASGRARNLSGDGRPRRARQAASRAHCACTPISWTARALLASSVLSCMPVGGDVDDDIHGLSDRGISRRLASDIANLMTIIQGVPQLKNSWVREDACKIIPSIIMAHVSKARYHTKFLSRFKQEITSTASYNQ